MINASLYAGISCADESKTTKQTHLKKGKRVSATNKQSTQTAWSYRGRDVEVPFTADIPAEFRIGHEGDDVIQEILDYIEEWPIRKRERVITAELDQSWRTIVTAASPVDERIWAKHVGHHAQHVQVSPFVRASTLFTTQFTVELHGHARQPKLVRAYPGGYLPPLPWQRSAEEGLGGFDESLRFWQTHAYVFKDTLIEPNSVTGRSPDWFQD